MAKRRFWLILAAAPVAVAAAVTAAAVSFDSNGQRDRIVAAVQRATGRTLTLAGPIRLGWGVTPTLEAEDVSLANMAGGTRPQMATIARAEVRMRLLPLLVGRVELASVTLVRPDILLETDASGRANWQFERAPRAGDPASTASVRRAPPLLDRLRIELGRVTWHDGVTGRTASADLPKATLDAGAGPIRLAAQAEVSGAAATVEATLGTVAQLTGEAGPFPVSVMAQLGDASLAFEGTADAAGRRLAGRLKAAVPDVRRTASLLSWTGLPPLRDVQVSAVLPAAGGLPEDVSIQAGASDLGSMLPGATLEHLALTWPAGQPARLDAQGALSGAPWHVASGLARAGGGVALRGLSVSASVGDLAGDLAVSTSPRPTLRGTLVSNRVDLDAVRALRLAPSPAPPVSGTVAVPAPPGSSLFSDAPLPWERLRQGDADLQLTIGTLHAGGADIRDVTAHGVLSDGALRLDPVSARTTEGRVDGSFSAEAGPESAALVVRSAGFDIGPLLPMLGLPSAANAAAEVDIALHATGASPHALASTMGGHAGVAMVDVDFPNAVLDAAFGELLHAAGGGLDPAGISRVRCLAVRADAQDGVVTVGTLKLDTSRLALDGSGAVNLADERMVLHLRPLLRVGGAGVSAPVRVDGAIRRPSIGLEPAVGRMGVMIGGLGGPAETCAVELAAARDGHAGRLPEPGPAGKAPKPADLLRSFLR